MNFFKKFFSKSRRELKRLWPMVEEINEICDPLAELSDDELRGKTAEFKKRLEDGETLDDLMYEAFAVVKETTRRFKERGISWDVVGSMTKWDMVPFDVQLIGAIVLHQGRIAEMATGEGKTLVASMPLYLNALEGKGAHLVTVNDYLAKRDGSWIGPIYHWLGLSVAIVQDPNANDGVEALEMSWSEDDGYHLVSIPRPRAYQCDIVYGRQDQFGFDYLYDNMTWDADDIRHRGFNYAIVDESDQLLIDEARTPLIISGQVPESKADIYKQLKPLIESLTKKQTTLVAKLVEEGERLLEEGETYAAGVKFLQAQRGAPKQRKLTRLREDPAIPKLITRVEMDFQRDKRTPELDEELFYVVEERQHVAEITENGRSTLSPSQAEKFLLPDISETIGEIENNEDLSDEQRAELIQKAYADYGQFQTRIHAMGNLIRAYSLFEGDVNYVVQDDKVVIVDEFTGRLQPGRRFSDGLHQALEAKENVTVERDTMTVATITVQNYFRMYDKLAGMTGTAETEENEFWGIYKLDVIVIPTNKPVRRLDLDDVIFRTKREKYTAIIEEIESLNEKNLPVLVGTRSVEVSELLSRMLQRKGVKHSVLNAKYHQQEAEIISRAGQPGAVTIATNMAGRGTDIKIPRELVKCSECKLFTGLPDDTPTADGMTISDCLEEQPCGLHIIGTERHDARRIDRQLRGRSGRQGDPGASQFFLSLEDDLMRLFGSERISKLMTRLGAEEGEVIQAPMVTKAIDKAQTRVENNNYDIRKRLLDYDDVMNQQREVIYDRRRHALEHEDLHSEIEELISNVIDDLLAQYVDPEIPAEEWPLEGLERDLAKIFLVEMSFDDFDADEALNEEALRKLITDAVTERYERRNEELRALAVMQDMEENELISRLERTAILATIDDRWRTHLTDVEDLKGGIHLRSYGQKDPVVEFKREAYDMFERMISEIDRETLEMIFKQELPSEREVEARKKESEQLRRQAQHSDGAADTGDAPPEELEPQVKTAGPGARKPVTARKRRAQKAAPAGVAVQEKVSRNAPCPCGSGKKYKHCCGKNR